MIGMWSYFVMLHHNHGVALSDASTYLLDIVCVQWRTPWPTCEMPDVKAFSFFFILFILYYFIVTLFSTYLFHIQ